MFHFYWPWMAILLPLPLLVRRLFPYKTKQIQHSPELSFPSLHRLRHLFPPEQPAFLSNWLFYIFLTGAWILLVIALMQPEKVDRYSQVKNTGYDLMLAVDISGSMQAIDFSTPAKKVSRLDVIKEVVGQFIEGRHGDRVGLVTFGEHAYLQVPLTLDSHSVSYLLNNTMAGMAGQATAIGDAIGLSVKTLREQPEGSRVLILLTDGEDNSSSLSPMDAAKLAKQYGIRIYTVGIGKNGPVHFPNSRGGYSLVEVPMDEALLKDIAKLTDGQYFRATDKKTLTSIYSKINELEKTESHHIIHLIREPYYAYFLGSSMILLFILSIQQLLGRSLKRNDE